MHPTLNKIQEELDKLIKQIRTSVPNGEPLLIAHGWNHPGLTRSELISEAQSIINLIDESGSDNIEDSDDIDLLNDYIRRIDYLRGNTIPNLWGGNGGIAVSAYLFTLNGLRKALAPALTRDKHAETAAALRKLAPQVRSMEARLKGLEPRTASLSAMVERIEQAYNAADQLPADLQSLIEARQTLEQLIRDASRNHDEIAAIRHKADAFEESLRNSAFDADKVIQRCESAYSAATSVGLATAFTERSKKLSWSMWAWVAGLVAALIAGSYFGTARLQALSELFKEPNVTTSVVILNLMLSLLSVGAPIWFGWLATKQIGQRFRLAEDYGFKASISRAYEGFRREAARFDKDMEARLLASALTRLDELPLRLVEADTHGSPWHEAMSSDVVKEAARAIPGFASSVKEMAKDALDAAKGLKGKPTPTSAAAAASPAAKTETDA